MSGLGDQRPWWRDAVIYEIYVRSFADADGDGLGDLAGIRSRLPDLADLGVDAVWLTPFYPSPLADGGYDVADYRDVDPRLGTLADVDALLATAHDLGLRVLIDVVPTTPRRSTRGSGRRWRADRARRNGSATSSDPAADRAGTSRRTTGAASSADRPGPGSPRSTARPGPGTCTSSTAHSPTSTGPARRSGPPSTTSSASGSTEGVDGFRIDVAHGLAKDPALPDIAGRFARGGVAEEGHPHWDQDEVHDVYRRGAG